MPQSVGRYVRAVRRISTPAVLLVALATLVLLAPASGAATTVVTAADALKKLSTAAEAGSTTYDRALFPHWIDADRDCQDTRAEVLVAESTTTPSFTTSGRCSVSGGSWNSWYDGATWTLPGDVDIDHIVALKEAWESGARSWTTTRRQAFANDLGVSYALDAVTDNVNQSKSDLDPARWLPPLAEVRCRYATTWVLVKYRWRLSVDTAERQALSSILTGTCGSTPVTLPTRPA